MTKEICSNIPHKETPEIVNFITKRMGLYEGLGEPAQRGNETGHSPEKLAEAVVKTKKGIPQDKFKTELDNEIKRIKKMDKDGNGIISMGEYLNSECETHKKSLINTPVTPKRQGPPINDIIIRRT